MQQKNESGSLYILGSENVRFLVEEPVKMALEGLKIVPIQNEDELASQITGNVTDLKPICLVVGAESLDEDIASWSAKTRKSFPWLPIVVLDHCNSKLADHDFLPQLVESVAVIQYPYTQKAVIDAIEKSIWWSQNLCRMLERLCFFPNLSERELAIVSMATDGVPNKSMARRLEVSIKTIEKNRRTAYEKLKITSSAEMAALVTFRRYFNRVIEPTREVDISPAPSVGSATTGPKIMTRPSMPTQMTD